MSVRVVLGVIVALVAIVAAIVIVQRGEKAEGHAAAPSAAPAPRASWVRVDVPTSVALRGVSEGADVSYAVGDHGTVLARANGERAWHVENAGTDRALYGVAQRGDEVIAVGDGVIAEKSGGAWRVTSALEGGEPIGALRGAAFSGLGAIAVGDEGVFAKSASGWRKATGAGVGFRGACAGLVETLVVGQGGTVLRAEGFAWKAEPRVTSDDLFAVTCDDRVAIAVGAHGTVIEKKDGRWSLVTTGGADLHGVGATFGMTSWVAVGDHGATVRPLGEEAPSVASDLLAVAVGPQGEIAGASDGLFSR